MLFDVVDVNRVFSEQATQSWYGQRRIEDSWYKNSNLLICVEENVLGNNVLTKNISKPKLDITSIAPLPCPAAPYVRIILTLNSSASFCIKTNAWQLYYYLGALSDWIIMSSLRMPWCCCVRFCSTSSTKISLCFVPSLRWWN